MRGRHERFVVGFYSPSTPYIRHTWRPREQDAEECDRAEASRRFDALVRAMVAGESVDGLVVCSVFEMNADVLLVTRSRTSDGHEQTDEGGDLSLVLGMSRTTTGTQRGRRSAPS